MQTHSMDLGFLDDQHINVTLHITLTGISLLCSYVQRLDIGQWRSSIDRVHAVVNN